MPRNLELEEAILADPEAAAGYAVYGDWLEQQGDPRGELIQVQLALELRPHDERLMRRERELLEPDVNGWLSTLKMLALRDFEVVIRRGFVYSATIPSGYEDTTSAVVLGMLMAEPVARFVRELSLGVGCSHHGTGDPDVSILEALRNSELRALRALSLDCFDKDISWTHVGDISMANASLRGIETLSVAAGRLALGAIDLPKLRTLRLVTGGLRAQVLGQIAAGAWPALEELEIYLGTEQYDGTCTARDVVAILEGANLPRVTSLALCNGTFADELAALVARSRILPRLKRLDLSKGTMGGDGARSILAHAEAFAHLDALDLSENYLPAEHCAQLKRIAANVDVSRQKEESQYGRFVSLGE